MGHRCVLLVGHDRRSLTCTASCMGCDKMKGGAEVQKPGDHPNFRKNAPGVKRPFSELSESSGVFSEKLSEFEIPFSEYEIPFSEWHLTTWAVRKPQFSEQLPERSPELVGTHMKDLHLPLHSRSVFRELGWPPRGREVVVGSQCSLGLRIIKS